MWAVAFGASAVAQVALHLAHAPSTDGIAVNVAGPVLPMLVTNRYSEWVQGRGRASRPGTDAHLVGRSD